MLQLVEAMKRRRSIRGYKPDLVPDDVITEILDQARRSPSSVNSQPWEFVVLTGKSLELARETNVEQTLAGAQMLPDVPAQLYTGRYRERQVELGKTFYGLMHIERDDQEGRLQWHLRGMRFFDAPAVILICLDESVYSRDSQLTLFDAGLVTQSIVLLALEYGLGTCIQEISVAYPEALKRALGIPLSKRLIVSVTMGYPDWDFPANAVETNRDPLEAFIAWKR
jgi:nitroreductase